MRRETEELEEKFFSSFAALSSKSSRAFSEEKCSIRTDFQRDRDRIIHSKSFRRLKHKTQVFISPEGDHFRTRLTHTLEVSQIARTIARALRLNEDLTEATALGHDLGHTPFGHAGEDALHEAYSKGFKHNEQSLRVVESLEHGKGLNLTWEVRDGILNHTGEITPKTLEGQIVKIADRIAYINHDIDDSLRAGIIRQEDLPQECIVILGDHHRKRIDTMTKDIIENSRNQSYIKMSEEISSATNQLRKFLFDRVYVGSKAKTEEKKAKKILQELFLYYIENPQELNAADSSREEIERLAVDYTAGMTDRYAISTYQRVFVPSGFGLQDKNVD